MRIDLLVKSIHDPKNARNPFDEKLFVFFEKTKKTKQKILFHDERMDGRMACPSLLAFTFIKKAFSLIKT